MGKVARGKSREATRKDYNERGRQERAEKREKKRERRRKKKE